MRYILIATSALMGIMSISSCTKVIDVELKDTDKRYVIEAVVTDSPGTCRVLLSQTKNFTEDNSFSYVSGATVTISDANGSSSVILSENASGEYTDASFVGVPGHTYLLTIAANGNTFTASSAMPVKVNFDTLYVTEDQILGNTNNIANLEFLDPPAFGNCYQARQYINGKRVEEIFVTNDDYTNNRLNKTKLFFFGDEEENAKSGDTITVDVLCINPAVYKYWYSLLQSASGGALSAAPANPVSNIEGGAIGYFSAHTIQTKSVVVP